MPTVTEEAVESPLAKAHAERVSAIDHDLAKLESDKEEALANLVEAQKHSVEHMQAEHDRLHSAILALAAERTKLVPAPVPDPDELKIAEDLLKINGWEQSGSNWVCTRPFSFRFGTGGQHTVVALGTTRPLGTAVELENMRAH